MKPAHRNIALLAAAQSLLLANGITLIAINSCSGCNSHLTVDLRRCRSPPMSSVARCRLSPLHFS